MSPLLAMASFLWTVCLSFLLLATVTKGASPKKVVDVPFGRNYVPTWAFDHIKYINGGSEIQLKLDKFTGAMQVIFFFFHGRLHPFFLLLSIYLLCINSHVYMRMYTQKGLDFNLKALTCLVTLACT